MPESPTREQLEEAEAYLRRLNLPADDWLLKSAKPYYTITELTGQLFGMGEATIRTALNSGEIPYAVLPNERAGWRIERSGLIYYVATKRREAARRTGQAAS